MNQVKVLGLVFLASASSLFADDVFDARSCYELPISRQEVIELLGPGVERKTVGEFQSFERKRRCNPVTGCGPWGKTVSMGKSFGSYFAVHTTMSTKTNLIFSSGRNPQFICWDIGLTNQNCKIGMYKVEGVVGSHCFWLQWTTEDGTTQYSTAGTF